MDIVGVFSVPLPSWRRITTAIIDMLDCIGKDVEVEDMILDILKAYPVLECDIKILALALAGGYDRIVEQVLPRAMVTPENRVVTIAAAQCAGSMKIYKNRLIPSGFFDDDGTRLDVLIKLVTNVRRIGNYCCFRESCMFFRTYI